MKAGIMDNLFKNKTYFVNQIFVVSGVLSTILSCGLALGYLAVFLDRNLNNDDIFVEGTSMKVVEMAGEVAFVPSIMIIPFTMQKKGRRIASLATIIPLLISWFISFDANHFTSLLIFNTLHNISLGGAVTISSVLISEYCSPKHRSVFLMLETAMFSLGVLLSHVSGMFASWGMISILGILTATYSFIVMYNCPESPHWLINQGHMVKCTESFRWSRGDDEEAFKELEAMLKTQKLQLQLQALRPIRNIEVKERVFTFIKSLLTADFLRPLSIMILLFSFIGFGGENMVSSYSLRNIFKLTNGKYIDTIVLDVLTLVCSLTACVFVQIVKRKKMFVFTGSISVLILAITSLLLLLQSIELFHRDYLWLFLSLITGFVMFMSLGTTALLFSLLGEIFPMSYKGIGSSLTCAYLWAFGNTILKLAPSIKECIGLHGFLFLVLVSMAIILITLTKIMPETNSKTLLEIEQLMKYKKNEDDYEAVNVIEMEEFNKLDKLKLFIEV